MNATKTRNDAPINIMSSSVAGWQISCDVPILRLLTTNSHEIQFDDISYVRLYVSLLELKLVHVDFFIVTLNDALSLNVRPQIGAFSEYFALIHFWLIRYFSLLFHGFNEFFFEGFRVRVYWFVLCPDAMQEEMSKHIKKKRERARSLHKNNEIGRQIALLLSRIHSGKNESLSRRIYVY